MKINEMSTEIHTRVGQLIKRVRVAYVGGLSDAEKNALPELSARFADYLPTVLDARRQTLIDLSAALSLYGEAGLQIEQAAQLYLWGELHCCLGKFLEKTGRTRKFAPWVVAHSDSVNFILALASEELTTIQFIPFGSSEDAVMAAASAAAVERFRSWRSLEAQPFQYREEFEAWHQRRFGAHHSGFFECLPRRIAVQTREPYNVNEIAHGAVETFGQQLYFSFLIDTKRIDDAAEYANLERSELAGGERAPSGSSVVTEAELIEATIREARIVFAQTTGFRFTGVPAEDLDVLPELEQYFESGEAKAHFDAGVRSVVVSAAHFIADRDQLHLTSAETLGTIAVMGWAISCLSYLLEYRGRVPSAADWKLGRGSGARAILEKRTENHDAVR